MKACTFFVAPEKTATKLQLFRVGNSTDFRVRRLPQRMSDELILAFVSSGERTKNLLSRQIWRGRSSLLIEGRRFAMIANVQLSSCQISMKNQGKSCSQDNDGYSLKIPSSGSAISNNRRPCVVSREFSCHGGSLSIIHKRWYGRISQHRDVTSWQRRQRA